MSRKDIYFSKLVNSAQNNRESLYFYILRQLKIDITTT